VLILLLLLVTLLTMFETEANVGELARSLRYLRFSQQCAWTFESSGMWCRVDSVSTDHDASIFRVKNSVLTACAEEKGHSSGTISPATLHHVPENPSLLHLRVVFAYKNLKLIFVSIYKSHCCNFLSTKWKRLGRTYSLTVVYASDISRWPLSWPHEASCGQLSGLVFQLNVHTCARWCCRTQLLLHAIVHFTDVIL
jgi:hypothetical protein